MTKDDALLLLWEHADSLIPPDLSREIAAAFRYEKPLPLKSVEQLRAEGVFIERGVPNIDPGETKFYVADLPEGALACDLAEVLSGMPTPRVLPYFSTKENCKWRTERALTEGFKWDPYGRKFMV